MASRANVYPLQKEYWAYLETGKLQKSLVTNYMVQLLFHDLYDLYVLKLVPVTNYMVQLLSHE